MARNTRTGYGLGLAGPLPALSPTPVVATRIPATTDINYEVGTTWINTTTNQAWIMTNAAAGAATWVLSSPGASDVDTINGLSPVAGNIVIAGGTNLTDVNAGNTVTLNMNAAITLATSVTSPIYTAAAGLDINAAAGNDITLQLGDAIGGNVIDIENSASATVASIDSTGVATFVGIDGILGGVTPAAATVTTLQANTSVTSPIYTSAAGADTNVNAVAGQDIVIQLGDAAGANFLNINSSTPALVASIDSTGIATFAGMDGVLGGVTPAAATCTTIQANTSVTSPLYTAAAADAVLQAGGANDVIVRLGDAAGATNFRIQSSTPADVFTCDSTGVFSVLAGLTIAGAFAQTAGTFNVGQDNAANAINIGGGTTARAIGIGNSAAAHVLTLGSATAAAQTIIQSGTAGLTLDSTGVLELNASGGAIGIGNDADAQAINVGTGAAARTITIGNVTGASQVDVNTGTGGFNVATTGTGDITLDSDDTVLIDADGVLELNSSGGIIGIGNDADAQNINVGTGAAARTITIGNVTGATQVDINTGTGGFNVATTGTGDITLDSDDTVLIDADGILELNSSAGIIGIGNDADAQNINIGTGAAARVITLGNVTGATQLVLNSGTGGIQLASTGAGDITIDSDDTVLIDADGVLELNSSAGIISIGNDADAQNINVGTGAAARTITIGNVTGATSVVVDVGTGNADFGVSATAHTTRIGSVTGASATTIQAGTGEITMTGTVKQIDAELMGQSGIYIPAFTQDSIAATAANTGGAPTGATGNVNLVSMQTGAVMQEFVVGAGQTILQPIMGANGLIINGDIANAEGYEYNFPYHQYTIGTSDPFAFELSLYINDMDGAAPYVFGFRKTEANNANWGNYDTYATMGMIAASSIVNVVLATELNGAGQTVTNTTDAWGGDGSTNTLRVLVDGTGNVTYTINGVAPSVTAAFQFDNADVVIPFIRIEHNANATNVAMTRMRIGYQA